MSRQLTHTQEADIAWMLDIGYPVERVAELCGVSAATVRRRDEQSGASLEFSPWIARRVRAIQDGWDDTTERERRAQQPDRPDILELPGPNSLGAFSRDGVPFLWHRKWFRGDELEEESAG